MKIENTKDYSRSGKFRFMIYGQSGDGKTQCIETLPNRNEILVLNTDKGMATLKNISVDYVSATKWSDVKEFLLHLKTKECKEKYKWVIFDSVTAMADILLVHLRDEVKATGFDLWGQYGEFMQKFLVLLRDQPDYHTLSIFEDVSKEDSNGINVQTFGVQGSIGPRVANYFDEVFRLRVDPKTKKRVFQTCKSGGYIGKDRSKSLEELEDANFTIIMNKIGGTNGLN